MKSGKGTLRIATCQFAVSGDPSKNGKSIRRQIGLAAEQGADVAHFPECALSGYAGTDLPNWDGYDWRELHTQTEAVMAAAKESRIWVILGSSHPLSQKSLKPHNSLYVIDRGGRLVDRYDKRFCTAEDLQSYSPGNHFTVFHINGITCGCLICYDVRFPELYREYKKQGVQVMFHSFHNVRQPAERGANIHTVIMRPTLQARAATNAMYVSANNSSRDYQSWPSVFIRPDGVIAASCSQNRAGMIVNLAVGSHKYYDAAGENRDLAMRGVLHSGQLPRDPRSRNRTQL